MTTYKTSELEGALLDAAVAKAEGYRLGYMDSFGGGYSGPVYMHPERSSTVPKDAWHPSTDWNQGGPIIERERILILPYRPTYDSDSVEWAAEAGVAFYGYIDEEVPFDDRSGATGRGPTLPIAAMRAYVASKLGETVELP